MTRASGMLQNALLVLLGGDVGDADIVKPLDTKPSVPSDNQDLLDLLGTLNRQTLEALLKIYKTPEINLLLSNRFADDALKH